MPRFEVFQPRFEVFHPHFEHELYFCNNLSDYAGFVIALHFISPLQSYNYYLLYSV